MNLQEKSLLWKVRYSHTILCSPSKVPFIVYELQKKCTTVLAHAWELQSMTIYSCTIKGSLSLK